MSKSIRIRTTPGESKNIQIKVEQDFDFLEIMSLKISQQDLYTSFCANYGVVVGRVIANKGFGVPNAKVSVFVPISSEDEKNILIKDLYPFKSVTSKDKNNVRYNLLLSKVTCELNVPAGTFPTKEEVLNNEIMIEIFDKYYKYTTKTNGAGDYMIFGVPTGQQTVHMDVDLSDAGTFSIRPYDLIDAGYSKELFKSRTEFKTSTNLNTLPQLKTGDRGVTVIPFWGDEELCEIGITRVDFDTNFNFEPMALYTGAIFTDQDKNSLNKRCNPTNDMGNQCELRTGAGDINIIRVADYQWDTTTDKIIPLNLEEHTLPQGTDAITDDGVFAVTVPMNVGHVVTDEFGQLTKSFDPTKGVPTKGLYRFKMKFNEPPGDWKRKTASVITPSLNRETGGSSIDPVNNTISTEAARWSTNLNVWKDGSIVTDIFYKDFHDFHWNQIYTLSQYIPKYKKGPNRFSFIGLKGVDECGDTNTIPFNNAIWSSDIIYGLMSFFIRTQALFLKLRIILNNLTICLSIKSELLANITSIFGGNKGLANCEACVSPIRGYTNKIRGPRVEKDIKGTIEGSTVNIDNKNGSILKLIKVRFKQDAQKNTNFLSNLTDGEYGFMDYQVLGDEGSSILDKDFSFTYSGTISTNGTCSNKIGGLTNADYFVWAKVEFEDDDGGNNGNHWINLGSIVKLKIGHFFEKCDCDNITDYDGYESLESAIKACKDYCTTINFRPYSFFSSDKTVKELPCESNEYNVEYICSDFRCNCDGIDDGKSFGIDFYTKTPKCCDEVNEVTGEIETISGCDEKDDCDSICLLNSWLCCAIYDLAIARQTIRYTFYDAWLNGSAYLPQFKYKSKIKNEGKVDEVVKDKFCGPGGDVIKNDNYKNQSCNESRGITDRYACIVRSPHEVDNTHNWVNDYHGNAYDTGASDSGEFIYCPETLPTKIVNIGRTDACQDTIDRINKVLNLNGTVLKLFFNLGCPGTSPNCLTGTYYEGGYDTEKWVDLIGNTSYENPELLMINMISRYGRCKVKQLFKGQGGCDEYELEDDVWKELHEISKIHADIVFGEYNPGTNDPADNLDVYDGIEFKKGLNQKFHPSVIGVDADKHLADMNLRHHFRNSPYFYFGIIPGRTAMDKLRKDYLIKP